MRKLLIVCISMLAAVGVAAAQSPTAGSDPSAAARTQGAQFSLDRAGLGKIEVRCAVGDTTPACLQAVLQIVGVAGGGPVFATISFTCGDKTFNLSTGNNKGKCTGALLNASCTDGKGNSAEADCTTGCTSSSGSGSCLAAK
jgi:hypothetical protein